MMIRAATPADTPRLVEMGRTQFESSDWHGRAGFDADSFAEYLGQALVLVADTGERVVGMFGGTIGAPPFNRNLPIFLGTFWYCEPEFRKEAGLPLLAAGEKAAKARGVRFSIVSTDDGERSAALTRLYRREGYQPAEQTYLKRF
jgi:hypothetical protein